MLFGTGERIAQRVAALTENRFQIRFFPAGEVVPGLQVLDAVQAGTIEAGHTPVYYYIGKDPAFAFFTALPFGLNARQNLAWLKHGGGDQLAAELLRDYNIVGFPAGDTGAQMGGWFRNEIKGLDDLKGLKFRIAGLAGQVFQRLGAVPHTIVGVMPEGFAFPVNDSYWTPLRLDPSSYPEGQGPTLTVFAPRSRARVTAPRTYGAPPDAEIPTTVSCSLTSAASMAAIPASKSSSAPSIARVSARSPPAMMPKTISGVTPNVGRHSDASSTPSRPDVPAPT